MGFIGDFIAGRTHKLARDFLGACVAIAILCIGAVTMLSSVLETARIGQSQSLPSRITQQTGPVQTQTIVRSVLDDNVTTASIGGRTIILDPCTGKEKK